MKAKLLDGKSCPLPVRGTGGKVLTRIFIEESGDLVVTDLWDEIRAVLGAEPETAPLAATMVPETEPR